jgi:hypothetical protein
VFGNGFDKISKPKKRCNSQSKVNIIPYGPSKNPGKSVGITKKNRISDNDIIRPEVNFISNARPAMLKRRDLEIEKTPIIKLHEIKKYKSRKNKKYPNNVPLHYGYSRKLVKARESPLPNIFHKKSLRNRGSSTSWLTAPSFVNGLPNTIYHFKYPLKTRKLNSVNDHHYDARDNVGSKL